MARKQNPEGLWKARKDIEAIPQAGSHPMGCRFTTGAMRASDGRHLTSPYPGWAGCGPAGGRPRRFSSTGEWWCAGDGLAGLVAVAGPWWPTGSGQLGLVRLAAAPVGGMLRGEAVTCEPPAGGVSDGEQSHPDRQSDQRRGEPAVERQADDAYAARDPERVA